MGHAPRYDEVYREGVKWLDSLMDQEEDGHWATRDDWVQGFDAGICAQMDPDVRDGGYKEKWYRNPYEEGTELHQEYTDGWDDGISCG